MGARFVKASGVAPCRLDAATPLGLFRPSPENDLVTLLWIVDHEDGRTAIVLETGQPSLLFQAWTLSEHTAAWTGLSLGSAELLVDEMSFDFSETARVGRGQIMLRDGKALVGATFQRAIGATSFEVGTSAASGAAGAVFKAWRLMQRDHNDQLVVVFEHGPKHQ